MSRERPGELTGSAQPLRDVEGVADGRPDGFGFHAVGERLVNGAIAEVGEHLVLGHALRVGLPELRAHPFPEDSETHPERLPLARGRTAPTACAGPAISSRGDPSPRTSRARGSVTAPETPSCRAG